MWEQIDTWHIKNGLWTITRADNVPMPYGLYKGSVSYGYFKTSKEAKERQLELVKEEK